MKTKQAVKAVMLIVTISAATFLFAQAPNLLNYQGKLTEGGNPVNGTRDITFAIYPTQTGGTALWTEQWASVPVTSGVFSAVLGKSTSAPNPIPSSVFAGAGERWLSVSVGGAEIGRFQLTSNAYAFRANEADGVADNAITSAKIQNGTITGADIASATIGLSNLNFTPVARPFSPGVSTTEIADNAVTSPKIQDGAIINGDVNASAAIAGTKISPNFGSQNISAATLFTESTGANVGVFGRNIGTGRVGEFDIINASNNAIATFGYTNGTGTAGYFRIDNTSNASAALVGLTSGNGSAVLGSTTGSGGGVFGESRGTARAGEFDIFNTSSSNIALFAYTNGTGNAGYFRIDNSGSSNHALVAITNGSGQAGFFSGRVTVTGLLTKSGGGFHIDHPLDPANKYLNHSFVESPDMLNLYNGNVTLDTNGEAWIDLPNWFGALNRDFRYQLTAIGAPGPNLYVAQEIQNNRFKIAGGKPGSKVSWQVTGIRQDAFANANRLKVEEDKNSREQGYFLTPELFGAPRERGIGWLYQPQMEPRPQAEPGVHTPTQVVPVDGKQNQQK